MHQEVGITSRTLTRLNDIPSFQLLLKSSSFKFIMFWLDLIFKAFIAKIPPIEEKSGSEVL